MTQKRREHTIDWKKAGDFWWDPLPEGKSGDVYLQEPHLAPPEEDYNYPENSYPEEDYNHIDEEEEYED